MKKKKILLVGIIILLTAILSMYIKDRIENRIYYNLKSTIKNEYSYVRNMTISNYGPHCTIDVYLKDNNCEYDKIEPIFIKMMLSISEPSSIIYFERRHCKGKSGELPFFHIAFRKQDGEGLYRFNSSDSYNHFQKWELDGNEKQCYYVSDYIDE